MSADVMMIIEQLKLKVRQLILDAGKVKEARGKEVQYVREKAVYTNITRSIAVR